MSEMCYDGFSKEFQNKGHTRGPQDFDLDPD